MQAKNASLPRETNFGEISGNLASLDDAVDNMATALDFLTSRLNPVLAATNPAVDSTAGTIQSVADTEVGERIASATRRVRAVITAIEEVHTRVRI